MIHDRATLFIPDDNSVNLSYTFYFINIPLAAHPGVGGKSQRCEDAPSPDWIRRATMFKIEKKTSE